MRRLVLLGAVFTVGLATVPARAAGPELSYYMTKDDCRGQRTGGCTPKSQTSVSIGYSIVYQLEDGSFIGADHGNWDGPAYGPSFSDITVTTGNAVVGDEVAQSWGRRLRDSIRGAIKNTSKLVPSHQLGRAAMILAGPGSRIVAGIGSSI